MSPSGANQARLLELLEREPYEFEFFAAVHALERIWPEREPVAGFADPDKEVVRFRTQPNLAFPASEVQAFEEHAGHPARMTVNFMGLAGLLGPLPHAYTTLILERGRARDHAFREFLDIFNHRMISLFYLAWEKYHFTVTYLKPLKDRFTHYLMDLGGLGTGGLQNRQAIHDHALVYYAGLLGLQSRPSAAFEQILGDHFGVAVEIRQMVGGWYPLDDDALCYLDGRQTPARQLGDGAVAGDAIWDHQAKARIRFGPLTLEMYRRFLPGGGAHEQVAALAMFYSCGQLDYEMQLVLAREEVPYFELGAGDDAALPLGLCSWAKTGDFDRDPEDAILQLAER